MDFKRSSCSGNQNQDQTNEGQKRSREKRPDNGIMDEEENFDQVFKSLENELNEIITIMCLASITDSQQTKIMPLLTVILKIANRLSVSQIISKPNIKATEATNITFHQIYNSISKIRSTYLRCKYYQQQPTYVAPVEKALGVRNEIVNSQSVDKPSFEKIVQSTLQYIPILDTLKVLFKSTSFKNHYFAKTHQCTEGIYEDICCGSNIKNNSLFKQNPNAIMIEIYYDEVEPADALKSCNGVHKLRQIYMRIGNLCKNIQSKWDQIYLVTSFY